MFGRGNSFEQHDICSSRPCPSGAVVLEAPMGETHGVYEKLQVLLAKHTRVRCLVKLTGTAVSTWVCACVRVCVRTCVRACVRVRLFVVLRKK